MRRTQPSTKGQNFFNNPCPIATMVTWETTTTPAMAVPLCGDDLVANISMVQPMFGGRGRWERGVSGSNNP